MALIPPFFLDCVVAIGFGKDAESIRFEATGFLYGKPVGEPKSGKTDYRVYLVTTRHVFSDEARAWLRFNPSAGGPARVYDLDLVTANGDPLWRTHPDPEVDIAVQTINVRLLKEHKIQFAFFLEESHILDRARARNAGLTEGDGIFILGFPLGQIGEERNYVIVREGAIARIRDTLAGASKEFLVDSLIFPGNSGGPVVTRPQITSIEGTASINSAYLIGVVSSYVPYQDVAVSQQTKRPRVVFEENSGLASVVPIDFITEVTDLAEQDRKRQTPVPETGE